MEVNPPGIDSSFSGIFVPEPATLALVALGLAVPAATNSKLRKRPL